MVNALRVFGEGREANGHLMAVEVGENLMVFTLSHGTLQQTLPAGVRRISGPMFTSNKECREIR